MFEQVTLESVGGLEKGRFFGAVVVSRSEPVMNARSCRWFSWLLNLRIRRGYVPVA
jgi:hypothetical protein